MKHPARHLERLRACFARLPDPRRGANWRHAMVDIGMAALSVFLVQSPSFLAHQRALAKGRRVPLYLAVPVRDSVLVYRKSDDGIWGVEEL